jgi:hypothetical protein
MKSCKVFVALFAAVASLDTAALPAAEIDMNDPRRVVGRENDVRVDAQLLDDTVTPGHPIGVTYQIENASPGTIAIADKVTDATYDDESSTITLSVGAEVPQDGRMPRVVLIAPGEKKVLRAGAMLSLAAGAVRTSRAAMPRFVQVKVTILRNLEPFRALISQPQPKVGPMLSDAQFDLWFESNATILLNTVPVRFSPNAPATASYSADQRTARTRF